MFGKLSSNRWKNSNNSDNYRVRQFISCGALIFATTAIFSCARTDVVNQRKSLEESSLEANGQTSVSIPVNIQELVQASGFNLAGNRISYAKFALRYTLSTDPNNIKMVLIGFNNSATPPSPLTATITGPLGAQITVVAVELVDFKTNNTTEPTWTNLTGKLVPVNQSAPLILNGTNSGINYTFAIHRNAISPIILTSSTPPINITYSVGFSLVDCLDANTDPNSNGTNCAPGGTGFGPYSSSGAVSAPQSEGVGAPKLSWNAAMSKVAVTNATVSPVLGKATIVLDCKGEDCPTRLKVTDGVGHRRYSTLQPVGAIPTATGQFTFKIIKADGTDITSNAITVFQQNPGVMFCIIITVENIALQKPTDQVLWFNDFRFELERAQDGMVGRSRFTLIKKQAFYL